MRARAVIFDFNGTLSDDEAILCAIFQELFVEQGRPLSQQQYFDDLAGLSDPEIVRTWLGPDHPAVDEVIEERARRYTERVSDGGSVSKEAREAVLYAAERVPVGLVSGAARAEIVPVLDATGLTPAFSAIVASEDVERGKPDPQGYVRALELLDGGLGAAEAVVLEDTEAGVAAAKAAGMRVIAVLGTLDRARLSAADEIVERLEVGLMRRLLG